MARHALLLTLVASVSGACNWVSLAANALTYSTIARGEAANLAVLDTLVYATLAGEGLAIVNTRSGAVVATVAPPAGSASIDDVAIHDGLLFTLDARAPGAVAVFSLRDPLRPRLTTAPRAAPVGPFSGISATGGLCIVSGGTSELTVWSYDSTGALAGPFATADLGRGQPDVSIGAGGVAYVSTHYRGPAFGLDVVRVDAANRQVEKLAELPIAGAGFTSGGAKPANFPIETAAAGDTVLLAYARGVAVIDVRDPRRPRVIETIAVGGPAVNVDARGDAALVAVGGAEPALVLLSFPNGRRPLITRRIPLAAGTRPAGVALTSAHAVVAARGRGVLVFER